MTAGIAAILVSLMCWFVYREDIESMPKEIKTEIVPREGGQMKALVRNRSLWYASVGTTAYMGAQFVILGYTQLFLHNQVHLAIRWAAYVLALALLWGMAGRILWGVISDRFFAGARKPVMLLIGGIMALLCLAMLRIRPGTPVWLVGLLFACFGFSAVGWNGVWVTLVSELAGKNRSGTAVGLGMTVLG